MKKLCLKYCVFLITFIYMLMSLFFIAPYYEVSSYLSTSYLINYNHGFVSRALIGSVYRILFNEFTQKKLFFFIFISSIILIVLLSAFLQQVYDNLKRNNSNMILFVLLFLFILISPTSIKYLFYVDNYGRLDLYLYIIFFLILNINYIRKVYFMIPVLFVIGIATHQAFFFLFVPSILLIIINEIIISKSKYIIVIFILSICFSILSFVYFQFDKTAFIFKDIDSAIIALTPNTDVYVHRQMLELEYFVPFSYHISNIVIPFLKEIIFPGFIFIVIYSPILLSLRILIKQLIKFDKCLFIFSLFTYLSMFALTIDWGRWYVALFTIITVQFLYYFDRKSDYFVNLIKKINSIKNKETYILIYSVYLLSIGYIQTFGLSSALNLFKMLRFLFKI